MIGEMVGRDAHPTKRNVFPEEGVVINDYDLRVVGIPIATIDIVNKIEYNSIIKY